MVFQQGMGYFLALSNAAQSSEILGHSFSSRNCLHHWHNHHYHKPPQLTKASFSHLPLSFFEGSLARKLRFHIVNFHLLREVSHESFVFTSSFFQILRVSHENIVFTSSYFSSNNSFRKHLSPAMSCACLLLILDEQRAPRKTIFQRKWFFQTLSFFLPLIVFPSAGFTPWSKNAHERGKGKGKRIAKEGKGKNRNGKGKEKERERKKIGKGKETERKRNGKGNEKGKEKRKGKRTGKRKGEGKGRAKEETGKREKDKKGSVSHGPFFDAKKSSFSLSFCYRSWILCVCVPFFPGNHQKRSVATTYRHLPCAESAPLWQQALKGRD